MRLRSAKSEEILRLLKASLPPKPPPVRDPLSVHTVGALHDDLKEILDEVGAEHYAHATARHFAKGGKYNRKPKQKYALT